MSTTEREVDKAIALEDLSPDQQEMAEVAGGYWVEYISNGHGGWTEIIHVNDGTRAPH